MRSRSPILALAALALGMAFAWPAVAQARRGGGSVRSRPQSAPRMGRANNPGPRTPIDEFETMPPAQRQRALDRLPPEQRQKLQERLDRFNRLPAEQQQALKNLYNKLHELPPQRQDAVRKSITKFSQESPQRQQAIREELRNMAAMSPEERQSYVSNPEFRSKFNKKEQEIVRDLSDVLPPQ